MRLVLSSVVERNWLEVKSRFNRELFLSLKPPLIQLQLLRFDGCAAGDEVHVIINTVGIKQKWISHITKSEQTEREWSFVDQGHKIPWPIKSWRHHHRVISLSAGETLIVDDINFECMAPWMEPLMYPFLWAAFVIRPLRYKKFFEG